MKEITTIYFVRHAKVDYIPDDYNRPLSSKGREDVLKVTEVFKDIEITKVVSSPYLRAVHTVEGIAKERNLCIETIEELKERKVAEEHIEDFNSFTEKQWKDFDYSLEGGESLNQVKVRAVKAVNEILKRYKGESIILGTHGTLLGVILNTFNSSYDYNFWKQMKMPDIFKVTFDGFQVKSIQSVKY